MTKTFHDPRQFLNHLESALSADRNLRAEDANTLLHGCMHTIRYLIDSQNALSNRIVAVADVLASNQESWGHKLAEIYTVMEAGDVTPEQMNAILKKEVCGASTPEE